MSFQIPSARSWRGAWPFVVSLCAVLLAMAACGAAAQSGAEPAPEGNQGANTRQSTALPSLLRETKNAAQEVDSGLISDARLDHWRSRLLEIRSQAATIEDEARRNLASTRRLLDALGPPPKDEQEPPRVAAQRQLLKEQVSEREARANQAKLVIARANEVLSAVQQTARERFANQLLVRGPLALAPSTWSQGSTQLVSAWSRLASGLTATELPQRSDWSGVSAIALAIGLAALMAALAVRTALLHRFPREEGIRSPTALQRVTGALLHTLFYLLVPLLVLGLMYGYLRAEGVLPGLLDAVARNAMLAVILGFLVDGLSRSVLAASAPSWRLAPVSDAVARGVQRFFAIGAALFAGHVFLLRMGRVLRAGEPAFVLHQFLFSLLVAGVVAWLIRRARLRREQTELLTTTTRRLVVALVCLAAGLSFASLVFATLGYYELSRYVFNRSLVMALLIGLILLVRAVVQQGIAAVISNHARSASTPDEQASGMHQFWLGTLADAVLLIIGIVLALPLWGVEWITIWAALRAALLGFNVGGISISAADLMIAGLLFAAILALTRVVQKTLDSRVFPQTRLDVGVRDSLRAVTGYAGLVIAALLAISTAGFNLSNLAIVAGALSVGIGFGLQTIVNNFVSGLILLFERPIKVGDWVVIGTNEGSVKRIRVRSTEIETFDRSSVIVPNSEFISQSITNWTHGNRQCRIIVPVPVAYGSDTQTVHATLLAVAREHPHVLSIPEPHVLFMGFGERGLDFELRVYSWDVNFFLTLGSELRFAIDQRFRELGIDVALPQLDLHVRPQTRRGDEPPPNDIPEPGSTPASGGPGSD